MQVELDVEKLEEVASKLRAVAHPMRVAIISMLDRNKQMNVTQIYKSLGIEQANASHHLNILKVNKAIVLLKDMMNYYNLKTNIYNLKVLKIMKKQEKY